MKTITTKVYRVNGQFDIYADENTKRFQSYASLASEMGHDWHAMSKRAKSNFRKRHANKIKEIPTKIEAFEVTATVPNIFSEFQLKDAAIRHLIHPGSGTLFLECKNGVSGYSNVNFSIKKL